MKFSVASDFDQAMNAYRSGYMEEAKQLFERVPSNSSDAKKAKYYLTEINKKYWYGHTQKEGLP